MRFDEAEIFVKRIVDERMKGASLGSALLQNQSWLMFAKAEKRPSNGSRLRVSTSIRSYG